MSSIQKSISVRDADFTSIASLVSFFNEMSDSITQSGMIQVADDEYAGQSKIFSDVDGVGFTKVTRVNVLGANILGYKVYKHPTLKLYVRVNFIDFIARPSLAAFATLTYQFSTKLLSGSFDSTKSSLVITPVTLKQTGSSEGATLSGVLPTLPKTIVVSCGPNYFWISRESGIKVRRNQAGAGNFPVVSVDPLSIGIFSSEKNNDIFCVVIPQPVNASQQNDIGVVGMSTSDTSANSLMGIRYMVCANDAWSIRENCAAGFLLDPSITSNLSGIRVAQAELIVQGDRHRFNFGFVNSVILTEFSVIGINLSGTQQRYQALHSIGSAGHAAPYMPETSMSIAVFPLVG